MKQTYKTGWFNQNEFDLRCEWGIQGAAALAPESDVVVIVDVLSFCTAVDIAVGRGALIYPYDGPNETAPTYAQERDAFLAEKGRRGQYSFSPQALTQIPPKTRLVLPSPNGSRLSLATGETPTLAACLRNYKAVARTTQRFGPRIAVIPAGERWRDGTIRPAVEDWLGAGAVLSQLPGSKSPMARAAEAAIQSASEEIGAWLEQCGSGIELVEREFSEDVSLAAAVDMSTTAPVLIDGAYQQHD